MRAISNSAIPFFILNSNVSNGHFLKCILDTQLLTYLNVICGKCGGTFENRVFLILQNSSNGENTNNTKIAQIYYLLCKVSNNAISVLLIFSPLEELSRILASNQIKYRHCPLTVVSAPFEDGLGIATDYSH